MQSCRRKDISCIYFFSNIESSFPKIHLRVFFPPRKRFKSFFFYLSKIEKFIVEKKIFLYLNLKCLKNMKNANKYYKKVLETKGADNGGTENCAKENCST